MIHKDCVNFKEIQIRVVWFPSCDKARNKKSLGLTFNCEGCGEYKKAKERIVSAEEKV